MFTSLGWAMQGFVKAIRGATLPYALGDWYWNPSRIIPAPGDVEPITEFPYFQLAVCRPARSSDRPPGHLAGSYIYHRHRAWLRPAGDSRLGGALWFRDRCAGHRRTATHQHLGSSTYLALGVVAVLYAYLRSRLFSRNGPSSRNRRSKPADPSWPSRPPGDTADLSALFSAGCWSCFLSCSFNLTPTGTSWATPRSISGSERTPLLSAILTTGGCSCCHYSAWMVWETRDWLARTPLSALRKLAPYRVDLLIQFLLVLVLLGSRCLLVLSARGIDRLACPAAGRLGSFVVPAPGQPDAKRIVLFLIGTG